MIKGTKANDIIKIINQIPLSRRNMVKEVTLDMAANINLIIKKCFPKALIVIDRFHVQKLALDAVQQQRVKYRWLAIDQENQNISNAKAQKTTYKEESLENGDTIRQLLARNRYTLFKVSK